MRVLAPAKINLHLRVGKRRDDGFHPLLTWMCTVGLFDKLIFERAPHPGTRLSCNWPDLPTDRTNLVLQAATALAPAADLSIHLEKHVPHGAGLGGGSSDAARTLLALNALLKLDLGKGQLKAVAARLGSDLPFFLHEPSALCQGRGDLVDPVTPPLPGWGVIVTPDIQMPTPAVYRRFDQLDLGSELQAGHEHPKLWCQLNSKELLQRLVNDLEKPAFSLQPHLHQLQEDLTQIVQQPVRMSGSGSSFFTLFDDPAEAESAAHKISGRLTLRAIPVELAPQIRDDLHEDHATRYTQ